MGKIWLSVRCDGMVFIWRTYSNGQTILMSGPN